ncbi:MAG: hypothetical protein HUU14_00245 [Dehalococcoidia bacterium]|nr:hypothetical protein [Dehalococcoidia bacterium]NUQ54297.1 hypothetical protein [Dehalococcoidia bacterium]
MPSRGQPVTFDLDGVLCRPPFGINPGKGKAKRRDAPGKKNLLWLTERSRYAFRRPMPGAREGFAAAMERFECHVVTARGEHARALTERWFRRYFGIVPPLHLRPHWRETSAQFKVRKLRELQPLAHFEDDPHTARWLAEMLPAVFLVDWGRNRWLEGDRIHRIRNLSEAFPILEDLADA